MPRRQVTSPLLVEIGARIREIRLEQGMSLDQLAKRSGVAKGNPSSTENGRVNITVETCLRIAAALGGQCGGAVAGAGGEAGSRHGEATATRDRATRDR
ncbi:helix-turn-helix domain-containing protein [Polyangium mundeleinium]|uniref:Helix-turn-helix transcriptional regulator n=1 Tax=Polyangium mundeleinium TaxID=2995306 RepID=A0ABT5EG76_9BACT|nr:helix-turn-helix transcriptional regulator [Polyangium mundeleinium]MDC0740837.1 helix-turn-helix transcriptional regulator [Polyangium mundeleinium]